MIHEKFLIPKILKNSALPTANQLARQLTWLIADGVIKKGEKLPTIRDYAEVLNIHHHTVRAAYHILEERKLVSISPRIGTIVRKYAPFVSDSHQDYFDLEMIAILVPLLTDFYQQIVSGVESVALKSKLLTVVLSCHEDPIFAETIYKNLSARGINGIINISLGFSDSFHLELKRMEYINVPLIFLDVVDAGTHSITIDTSGAIGLATHHLLDHGYSDLAMINCPADWPIGREALKGFRQAFESRGLDFSHTSVFTVPDFGYDAGRFIVDRMLQNNSLPRGIVTVSDNLAIGVISALKENGLRVPHDVAIIGFNDIFPASMINPPLSTIALPLFDMGQLTMLSMNRVLTGKMDNWIHKSFSGKLVIRESCGCNSQSSE
jgi:DNA-binding LacI/PurR family transcriptional regulator